MLKNSLAVSAMVLALSTPAFAQMNDFRAESMQSNAFEVQSAQIALQKSRNGRIRNYAQEALRDHHDVHQKQRRLVLKCDQNCEADREPKRRDRPHPFASDPVGQMSERNLPRNAEQADETERPCRRRRGESDLDEIFGLVNLNRVPDVKPAEISEREPPEA